MLQKLVFHEWQVALATYKNTHCLKHTSNLWLEKSISARPGFKSPIFGLKVSVPPSWQQLRFTWWLSWYYMIWQPRQIYFLSPKYLTTTKTRRKYLHVSQSASHHNRVNTCPVPFISHIHYPSRNGPSARQPYDSWRNTDRADKWKNSCFLNRCMLAVWVCRNLEKAG